MRNLKLLNLLYNNAKRGSFKAEGNSIYLYDIIVSSEIEAEWFGGVTPKQIADQLKGMTGDVALRINSPGGDVFAAVAMSQMLREYSGNVVAHVDGYAASAASIVACAADECVMAPGSMMMIHKAWTIGLGNADDMRSTADLLDKIDQQIAQGYAEKSGKDAAGFIEAMAAETWFTDTEAVDAGLADRVAEPEKKAQNKTAWDFSAYARGPQNADPVTTVTTTKSVKTITEEETETETVEVIAGDPSTLPPEDSAPSQIEARQRQLAVRLLQAA
jgi:ATP-dependent protease ClpP protease subunit